ncbi:MAG: hypothetical protein AB1Z98_34590 [Nannocystaceae bacterium]
MVMAVGGCGPTVSLDDPRDPGVSTGSFSTGTRGPSSDTVGTTAASSSTRGTSAGMVDTEDEGSESSRLDVASRTFDLGAPPRDQPMYAPCDGDEQCMAGLECVVLAYGQSFDYSICTAQCTDPTVDCEPAPRGWEPTCALHVKDGQADVCAIACGDERECPPQQWCSQLFGPGGRTQTVCVP